MTFSSSPVLKRACSPVFAAGFKVAPLSPSSRLSVSLELPHVQQLFPDGVSYTGEIFKGIAHLLHRDIYRSSLILPDLVSFTS